MEKKNKIKIATIFGIIVLLMGIYFLFGYIGVRKGVNFIKEQESKDVEAIETMISPIKNQEIRQAVDEGRYEVYDLLGNYVFYGDSRVLHYAEYGLVDATRILANNGCTYAEVPLFDDQLKKIKPDNIFISYGVNDIYYEVGKDEEGGYNQVVEDSLLHIMKLAPNAKIYVLGMIPVSPAGMERLQLDVDCDSYNNNLKSICEKVGNVHYIDDETLSVDGLADIYAEDGYHFNLDFYPVWTTYIVDHME